jgi:hypothetical protein
MLGGRQIFGTEGGLRVLVYTVTKPVGTKDREFEAYTRLLEGVGIDVSNAPRVLETGTNRRWLYAWKKKIEADRFVAELRRRTGDQSWFVHEFDIASEETGPVAPLDVARIPEETGYTYYLTPSSRERVVTAYPGTRLSTGVTVTVGDQQDLLRTKGPDWWAELARILTGRTDDEIDAIGGVRFIVGEDAIPYERVAAASVNH